METSCQNCVFKTEKDGRQSGCRFDKHKEFVVRYAMDNPSYILNGFCNHLRTQPWASKNNIAKLSDEEVKALIKEENTLTADIIVVCGPNDTETYLVDTLIELNRSNHIHNVIVSLTNPQISIVRAREILETYCRYPKWQFVYNFEQRPIELEINAAFKYVNSVYYGVLKCEDYFDYQILPKLDELLQTGQKRILVVENSGISNSYVQSFLHKKLGGFSIEAYKALAQEQGLTEMISTMEDLWK